MMAGSLFPKDFLAWGPWENPVFSDPCLIAAAAPLTTGKLMSHTVVTVEGAAGLVTRIENGGPKRLFMRTLRGPLNGQVPWAGVTYRNASRQLLEDLADKVFASRWDRLELGPFPDFDEVTAEFVDICRNRAAAAEETSRDFHAVNGMHTLQDLLEAQSTKPRKNQRRAIRLVDDQPENEIVVLTGADAEGGLERFLAVDRMSWKADDGEALALNADLSRFYRDLFHAYADTTEAAVLLVRVKGEDAAGILMLVRGCIGYLYKTSFVKHIDTGSFSLGTIAILCGIRWLLEERRVDRIMVLSEADYARHFSHGTVAMRICRLWNKGARAKLLKFVVPSLSTELGPARPKPDG